MFERGITRKTLSIVFLFFIFALPNLSEAQVYKEKLGVEMLGDFVLEPAKNEVILNPGQSANEKLSITNRMNKTVTFQIEVEDIVGSENPDEQVKLLGQEKGPYSLKNFLTPEITEFTLEAGEKITIPIKVDLPADSEPRGYYGALIVSAKGEDSLSEVESEVQGTTKLYTRLGSIFLVRINGDLIESSTLADFKAIGPKSLFYFNHPKGFEVAVKNEGNVHLVHYGEIKIKNIFGKEVKSLPINAFFSLPDSTRYREITWDKSFAFGFYKAEVYLYKGFGDKQDFLTDNISFFIVSWKLLVAIVFVTAIILFIIRFFKRNFKIQRKK